MISFSGVPWNEEVGLERYWNLTGKSLLVVWNNENSASRKMALNLQCKFLLPEWPGRLLLYPAELKGCNLAANAYESQRWFIARAYCWCDWSMFSKASVGHSSLWWDVNAARGHETLGFLRPSSILNRLPSERFHSPSPDPNLQQQISSLWASMKFRGEHLLLL